MPPRPRPTKQNPHALTFREQVFVEDIANDFMEGNKINQKKSAKKAFHIKNDGTAASEGSNTINRPNVRQALIDALYKRRIFGKDGKVENVLVDGLDAKKTNNFGEKEKDHSTRLAFVKELNKIAGAYAPEQKEVLTGHFKLDKPPEQIDAEIDRLQSEINDDDENNPS